MIATLVYIELVMNFNLRKWEPGDLGSLLKYADNFEIAKNLMNRYPYPYTEEAGRQFIEFSRTAGPSHIFAIEIEGEAAGSIGIHLMEDIFCKNAELGYWLGEPFWSKGITTLAVGQMLDYAFETFDIERVFARPFHTNLASQRVLEKAGFVLEACLRSTIFKNGLFYDELIYGIKRGDWLRKE